MQKYYIGEHNTMSDQSPKTRFGLNPAEYDNFMQAIRYGIIIVITVLITFSIVTMVASLLGYAPPTTGETAEVTPDTSAVIFPEQLAC